MQATPVSPAAFLHYDPLLRMYELPSHANNDATSVVLKSARGSKLCACAKLPSFSCELKPSILSLESDLSQHGKQYIHTSTCLWQQETDEVHVKAAECK